MKYHWKFWKKKKSVFSSKHEKLVRDALKIYDIDKSDSKKNQEELHGPRTFTPEFEQKMIQMLQDSNSELEEEPTKNAHFFIRILKVVVIVLCAAIVTISFAGMTTDAIRFPKFSYLLKKGKDSYTYLLEQKGYGKDLLTEIYVVTYIPKPYKLEKTFTTTAMFIMYFSTEDGKKCSYHQFGENMTTSVDDNITDYKEMVFGESKFYMVERNSYRKIMWFANGYHYVVEGELPVKELVKMAQSIEIQ